MRFTGLLLIVVAVSTGLSLTGCRSVADHVSPLEAELHLNTVQEATADPAPDASTQTPDEPESTDPSMDEESTEEADEAAGEAMADEETQRKGFERQWEWSVTPYLWAAELDGSVTINGNRTSGNIKFSDIVENLDLGLIGHVEASRDDITLFGDLVYLRVSDDVNTPIGKVDVEQDSFFVEGGAAIRMRQEFIPDNLRFEFLGGNRYIYIDGKTKVKSGPAAGLRSSADRDWIDLFVGGRAQYDFNERWNATFRADIGGFDINSKLTWQLVSTVQYAPKDNMSFIAGYRLLDIDYSDGSGASRFEYDVKVHGPVIGVTFTF